MVGLGLKGTDLQALAKAKLADAEILLENKRYSNAYYLAGYAVELGLKACIASQFAPDVIPDRAFVNQIYQLTFKSLVGLAGLTAEHKNEEDKDRDFAQNWALVAQWSPEVRYATVDPLTAQTTIAAIGDPKSGVMKWIKAYW